MRKVVHSFDVVHGFRLMPTLSSSPPERANAVVVVVVVVIVDVASRRNARKIQRTTCAIYFLSLVLQARDIYLTSLTIFDQYSADCGFRILSIMDSSM